MNIYYSYVFSNHYSYIYIYICKFREKPFRYTCFGKIFAIFSINKIKIPPLPAPDDDRSTVETSTFN